MNIEAALRNAVGLHQQGRTAEALDGYLAVLAVAPNNEHALNFSGAAYVELGRLSDAISALERATEVRPDYAQAFANLGVAYRSAGRFDDAVRAHERVVSLLPQTADAWNELGIARRRVGDYARAEEAYRRAIAIAPEAVESQVNLGNVLQDLDRMEDAVAAYRQALTLAPDIASVHRGLGNALQRLGRNADAADAYRQALACDPRYVRALVDLGGALVETGHAADGAERLREAAQLAPDDVMAHSNLGTALQVLGEHERALDAFERALAIDPGNTHALSYLCISLHALGHDEQWRWLSGLESLVRQLSIAGDEPSFDVAAFNQRLSDYALQHPSVPGGRRPGISSELFLAGEGPPIELMQRLHGVVQRYIRDLPSRPDHPFIARKPERFRLSGWCNVLSAGADSHVHPNAWLSGVYYARCEGVTGDGVNDAAGCLEVGPPDDALYDVAGYPRRVFAPEEGTLVVFPSYVWHRILPFDTERERISYAFDVIPDA